MKIVPGMLALGTAFACAHTPEWTPQQRRALQTRSFQASYRNVFLAIKDILQDDGYQIKSQDYRGGLIVAKKNIDRRLKVFGLPLLADDHEITGVTYQVSFNIEQVSKGNTETRLTIAGITQLGSGRQHSKEVVEPQTYQAIYRNLQLEIKRRQARGKT